MKTSTDQKLDIVQERLCEAWNTLIQIHREIAEIACDARDVQRVHDNVKAMHTYDGLIRRTERGFSRY